MSTRILRRATADDPLVCIRSRFWNFNSVGLAHDGDALVVDPGIDPLEIDLLRDELGGPVRHVVLTHSHHDHIRGWQRFPGARVVMQRVAAEKGDEARARILAAKQRIDEHLEVLDPDFSYPRADLVFDDELRLEAAGHELRLVFLPGHSDCTSLVWIPALGTLCSADYLVEPGLPYCRWEARAFEQALEQLAAFCEREDVRRIVPSHNDWIEGPAAIAAALERERTYFQLLRSTLRDALERGDPRARAERQAVQAVRAWRGRDLGKRARQDEDNARRVALEECPV